MNRSDLATYFKNESMKIIPELQSQFYKSKRYKPMYSQYCKTYNIADMEWQSTGKSPSGMRGGGSAYTIQTSLIGVPEFQETNELQPLKFQDPGLGFPVYMKKRKFEIGVELTVELDRDFKALDTKFQKWVQEQNFAESLWLTKERFAAGFINNGATTAAAVNSVFDNSLPGVPVPYGALVYDGVCLFNQSNNTRTNKVGTTYYNHMGAGSVIYDNVAATDQLLRYTNAFTENNTPFINNIDNFVMVNPYNELAINRILTSTLLPGGSINDINPLNGSTGTNGLTVSYKPIFNPFMTSTSGVVLGNKMGIYFYDSDDIIIKVWEDPVSDVIRMKGVVYLAAAPYDWRALACFGL